MRGRFFHFLMTGWRCRLIAAVVWTGCAALGAEPDPAGAEFFEKKIRPILSDRCYKCHSSGSEKLKGGLLLDSRTGLLKGGEGGKVIDLEAPEKSRLLEAIGYENPDLQMPPKGKLPQSEIAALSEWIKMGAPWPETQQAATSKVAAGFDLAQRRREHWAWQPIQKSPLPAVRNERWPAGAVDRFILAKLEANGLSPAPAAERRVLIRRLYFDLVGLPPTPEAVEQFVSSRDPDAWSGLVAELLASPHFGERWARHWLDLVRYSETLGHEFDYALLNAWRYRDYVIRALNADVRYDTLITEHLAGDLLAKPRQHPAEGFNESVIGTAFLWFGQREHSPVDVRGHQAEVIDNQVDVLTKTFLGLTVACARCHDHKFDAISTRDYYALYGVMESSRYSQSAINPIDQAEAARRKSLARLKTKIARAVQADWSRQAAKISSLLMASRAGESGRPDDAALLSRWAKALKELNDPAHPLYAWTKLAAHATDSEVAREWQVLLEASTRDQRQLSATNVEVFAEGRRGNFPGWFSDSSEADVPVAAKSLFVGSTNPVFILQSPDAVCDSALSCAIQKTIRSPTFDIRHRYLHVLGSGQNARVKVCVDNFTMIRDPIYGRLKQILKTDRTKWLTFDLNMWTGHRAYVEITDIPTADPTEEGQKEGYSSAGFFAVNRVVFSAESTPPAVESSWVELLGTEPGASLEGLATRYQVAAERALRSWRQGEASAAQLGYLNWLVKNDLLDLTGNSEALLTEYRKLEATLADPMRVPAMSDGNGIDERVFIRGNPKAPGELVPRQFLAALRNAESRPFGQGSGRLELAACLTDSSNPLVSRVVVNRVWQHLFGRGLVPTPDDFGVLGQPPSHPELLDWLANWFRTEGKWSVKNLIRLLVNSNAYRMSSLASNDAAESTDPENKWLHRMPIRRLEGEAIRDAMLSVSGRLDPTLFGRPVPIHLTEFMEGAGRPGESGPLDGRGRRSVYLEVRRNFPSPMMRTFDAPVPFTTIGRRTVSNLPSQSLILLNDPFVLDQARVWARRLIKENHGSAEERVGAMYLRALGRAPSDGEQAKVLAFLKEHGDNRTSSECLQDEQLWTDVCHVMFNLKEFIFIE